MPLEIDKYKLFNKDHPEIKAIPFIELDNKTNWLETIMFELEI